MNKDQTLLQQFLRYIREHNLFSREHRLLLAVSGGIDSVVLCELCHQAGFSFEIAHCNFQLRGAESEADAAFVTQMSTRYKVPFHIRTFETTAIAASRKQSIETTARDLRYEWFHSLLSPGRNGDEHPVWVLTGHHADDNIETLLMNFFRGTGIRGLRGMLPVNGKVLRPLLFARRSQLEEFIQRHDLPYVTDATNLQNDYTRNYFRNKILPQVRDVFPESDENLLHNIERFGEIELLYQQAIGAHLSNLAERKGNELHIPVLKLLRSKPLHTIIYEIIHPYGFTAGQVDDVVNLLGAASGKYILSGTHRILKNRNWIIIAPVQDLGNTHFIVEEPGSEMVIPSGILQFSTLSSPDFKMENSGGIAQMDASEIRYPLIIRRWKQGDYFYPLGMRKKKKLSRFFIDNKLSLIDKENTWVIESDKRIVWVIGQRIDDRVKVVPGTSKILRVAFTRNADG